MKASDYRELSDCLKTAREAKGLTQRELAEKLGYTSAQFISNWERDVARLPLKIAPRILRILGIPHTTYIRLLLIGSRRQLKRNLKGPKDC